MHVSAFGSYLSVTRRKTIGKQEKTLLDTLLRMTGATTLILLWRHNAPYNLHCERCSLKLTLSINKSIFIYIRQPYTNTYKKKKNTHNTVQNYHTDRREKRATKSLLERDIGCRSSHLYFSVFFSNRSRANSLNIMVTL